MTAMISDSSLGARRGTTPRERPARGEIARGRAAERKIIGDLLRHAEQGVGGVALVDGEPGIGKSLLLRDAVSEAAEHGFSLAVGTADQLGEAIPLFALRGTLCELFSGPADDPLRDLPDATAWWISRIRAQLERRTAAAPVLVCLDDLHQAGRATLAALQALPRNLERRPVAWILARSNTPEGRRADYLFSMLEKEGATRIILGRLDDDAVAAMITDKFGVPPDQGLADLARGAAGNPSLVAELITGLRDDHAVRVTGGRAVLASAPVTAPRSPPRAAAA